MRKFDCPQRNNIELVAQISTQSCPAHGLALAETVRVDGWEGRKKTGQRKKIHLDIGGFGEYADAINLTNVSEGYKYANGEYGPVSIVNLILGQAEDNLKAFKDGVVSLITIENAPYSDAIMNEAVRVLKSGGELQIKTGILAEDFSKIASMYNLKLKSVADIIEDGIEYKTATFTK